MKKKPPDGTGGVVFFYPSLFLFLLRGSFFVDDRDFLRGDDFDPVLFRPFGAAGEDELFKKARGALERAIKASSANSTSVLSRLAA